ncbi:hypothetical protein CW354_19800 [Marinicaulis flavus]|uniref:Uncharacterized protein n=1 Tax=Hyphococcus luteus TaxID=2058213 RepID=A0A2S7JZW6_9PROT|nr:hypothetical protein CW354_19800 [Marinicaulis flavus]
MFLAIYAAADTLNARTVFRPAGFPCKTYTGPARPHANAAVLAGEDGGKAARFRENARVFMTNRQGGVKNRAGRERAVRRGLRNDTQLKSQSPNE